MDPCLNGFAVAAEALTVTGTYPFAVVKIVAVDAVAVAVAVAWVAVTRFPGSASGVVSVLCVH